MTPQEAKIILMTENIGDSEEMELAKHMGACAIDKFIPKKPVHIYEEYDHHEWEKNPDGSINECAWDYGTHNGVACERCNQTYCVFCDPDYDEKGDKCIIDEHYCPNCGKYIISSDEYCNKCGQHIAWGESNE